MTRTGADAASAAAKVGGTQNIPASQKVTPTSSTSGPGRGSIKFQKGALSKLVSGNKPTANTVTKPDATSSSSSKTIGVDPSPGKSDTKSVVNNNKKKNIKNANKVSNQMNQLGKKEAEFTGEPAATTTVGKISDF